MSETATSETPNRAESVADTPKRKHLSGFQKRKRRRAKLLAEEAQLASAGVTLTARPSAAVRSGRKKGDAVTRLDVTLASIDEIQQSDAIGFLGRVIRGEEIGLVGISRDGLKIYDVPKLDQRMQAAKILAQWAGADKPVEAERAEDESARSREELVREVLATVARLAAVAAPRDEVVAEVEYAEVDVS